MDDGLNIVTTHKLFDTINMREFDISGYHLIIDEVFDCVKYWGGPDAETFRRTYIDGGLVKVFGVVR